MKTKWPTWGPTTESFCTKDTVFTINSSLSCAFLCRLHLAGVPLESEPFPMVSAEIQL